MDGLNVACSMNEWMSEWFTMPNNMDEWMVWHIIVVAMCWQEIQNLNYSRKLFEMMLTCIVES